MTSPRICLITGNHLCHNPRVLKEAAALSDAGFDVEVLGAWIDGQLKERDQDLLVGFKWKYTPVIDMTGSAGKNVRRRLRIRNRIGRMIYQWCKIGNIWQLGYSGPELYQFAKKHRADLFIGHSEPALWVIDRLARNRQRKYKLAFDMEDWFSEDLLPAARRSRPVNWLAMLERNVLQNCDYTVCTSQAMATQLARNYQCPEPHVVYNTFPWSDAEQIDGKRLDRALVGRSQSDSTPSVHWFSQTIGPGRGLEDLFAAMPLLYSPIEIHLRGRMATDGQRWLDSQIPPGLRNRIRLHPLVPNDQLLSRIAEHDIGLAGEMNYCESRNLTVTNKLFQYLLAGLAIAASDTAGQVEVGKRVGQGIEFYTSGSPESLAKIINRWLADPSLLKSAKSRSLAAARSEYHWEVDCERHLAKIRKLTAI